MRSAQLGFSHSSSCLSCLFVLLLCACPGDDATGEEGPSADSGGSGTTLEPATTEAGDGSSETASGQLGCEDLACGDSEWCDYTDDECSNTGFSSWSCEARPQTCDTSYEPVCGCDGQIHSNECAARMTGVDLDAMGRCTPPEDTFACGPYVCELGDEFCGILLIDLAGEADIYECADPPMGCEDELTCDCLLMVVGEECSCEGTPEDGVEVRCPAL
jgi:hypothetical protein